MTPAVPASGQPRRDPLPCPAGSCGQEAVTSGVTDARADQDAAVWRQEADLPDRGAPSGASSRPPQLPDSWTILGGHQAEASPARCGLTPFG